MTDSPGLDLNALLAQAQAMQQQVHEAQRQQAQQTVLGSAGGGKIEIEATGDGQYRNVKIDPSAVDPDDVELLEELVLAALRDVANQVEALQQDSISGILPDELGGLDGLLGG